MIYFQSQVTIKHKMKVWAVANQKGGVGKTTTAVTLGGTLAMRGKRVLLVDLDPHGSMTSYFGFDPDDLEPTVYDLFHKTAVTPEVIIKTKFKNLSFLPASSAMATLDRQLGNNGGMGLIVKNALEAVSDQYDYAVIDCPPVLGLLMVNALAACNHLLVPVQTEFLAAKGLERMVNTLNMIIKARKQQITYSVVPTFFDQRLRASTDTLKQLREKYKDKIWNGVIPIDTLFREASRRGIPLSIARPSSRGCRAYSHLLDYLLGEPEKSEEIAALQGEAASHV